MGTGLCCWLLCGVRRGGGRQVGDMLGYMVSLGFVISCRAKVPASNSEACI